MSTPCPCCSGVAYSNCCEPLLNGTLTASSAEQLMRSRFCAFKNQNAPYLLKTIHNNFKSDNEEESLASTLESTQWLSLRIIKSHACEVEFVAFFKAEPVGQLHERSNFVFENGEWFYTDGEMLPDIKLNRNDICYCGSGKKHKKCCL